MTTADHLRAVADLVDALPILDGSVTVNTGRVHVHTNRRDDWREIAAGLVEHFGRGAADSQPIPEVEAISLRWYDTPVGTVCLFVPDDLRIGEPAAPDLTPYLAPEVLG